VAHVVKQSPGVTARGFKVGAQFDSDMETMNRNIGSLAKSDLREYAILTTPGCPRIARSLPTEIADVVAYLRSLKGP